MYIYIYIYIVCKLDRWNYDQRADFVQRDSLQGAVKLTIMLLLRNIFIQDMVLVLLKDLFSL